MTRLFFNQLQSVKASKAKVILDYTLQLNCQRFDSFETVCKLVDLWSVHVPRIKAKTFWVRVQDYYIISLVTTKLSSWSVFGNHKFPSVFMLPAICQKWKLYRNGWKTKTAETENDLWYLIRSITNKNETFLAKLQTNMKLYGSFETENNRSVKVQL